MNNNNIFKIDYYGISRSRSHKKANVRKSHIVVASDNKKAVKNFIHQNNVKIPGIIEVTSLQNKNNTKTYGYKIGRTH